MTQASFGRERLRRPRDEQFLPPGGLDGAEAREDAFRPFHSGSPDGTGLGLAIARDIVRAHGGDIALETSPLGGLRARIRLPV